MNKVDVKAYVDRRAEVEREINLLKEDLKGIDTEFTDKLDVKAVKAALRILKAKQGSNEDTVDSVLSILEEV